MTEGYCMKCKKKIEIGEGIETLTKRGVRMLKGKCPVCNITVCRMLGKAKEPKREIGSAGVTTFESMTGLFESKPKSKETEKKVIEESKKEDGINNMYLGHRIIEDNNVKELRLPKDVIDFLGKYANWNEISKELEKKEIVPGKFYICFKCGWKRPKIKNTQASMFICPKCHKILGSS